MKNSRRPTSFTRGSIRRTRSSGGRIARTQPVSHHERRLPTMQTLRTRFSMLLLVFLSSLSVGAASAQPAKKITRELPLASPVEVQKSWDEQQQNIESVEKLLAESGQPYINAGKGVWVIRRHGENLNFQLVLYTEAESLFTEVIVAKGKSLKLDEAKPYVLGLAKRSEERRVGK